MKNSEFLNQRNHFLTRLSMKMVLKNNITSISTVIRSLLHPIKFFKIMSYFFFQLNSHHTISDSKITFLYGEKMVDYLLSSGKSLIRFGDGEVFHYYQYEVAAFLKNQTYQGYNSKLTEELRKIVNEINNDSSYALAIHLTAISMNNLDNLKSGLYSLHYLQRYFFKKELLPKFGMTYLDVLAFRPESKLSNDYISKLWNNRDVVIVNSDEIIYSKFRTNHNSGKTFWVKIPSTNAYSRIDSIITETVKSLSKDKTRVILVAAGAAGKAIVYRLSKLDYISYDLGHYFDWKFQGLKHE